MTRHSSNIPTIPIHKTNQAGFLTHIIIECHVSFPYKRTLAPIPLPMYHSVSVQDPTLTLTLAFASSFSLPPSASFSLSRPTESRDQSTGNLGVVDTPGGQPNGESYLMRPISSVWLYMAVALMCSMYMVFREKGEANVNVAVEENMWKIAPLIK